MKTDIFVLIALLGAVIVWSDMTETEHGLAHASGRLATPAVTDAPAVGSTFLTSLAQPSAGDVHFLVTDPLGRRKGIDPETGAEVAEVPGDSARVRGPDPATP